MVDRGLMTSVVVFCNPLLDVSVTATAELLEEFRLKANDAILSGPAHSTLLPTITSSPYTPHYSAGGSGMNTLRAALWASHKAQLPKVDGVFMGGLGDDQNGQVLREYAAKEGVMLAVQVAQDGTATGTCCCLISQNARSLVCNLAAANLFSYEQFLNSPEAVEHVTKASLVYSSGFFLGVSYDTVMHVASRPERPYEFALNLSAPFVCAIYTDKLISLLPHVSLLFGNIEEARILAASVLPEVPQSCTDHEIVAKLFEFIMVKRETAAAPLRMIITRGHSSVLVASTAHSELGEYEVPLLPQEQIIDTNGAGDAFVGGFLGGYMSGLPEKECIEMANSTAAMIIKTSGVEFSYE